MCAGTHSVRLHIRVCVCVFFIRSVVILSEFVCLFNSHFSVCISLIYTDKSISVPLRTHYVLWLFSIYLCCAPAFFHSRSLLSFARLIAEAAFTFHLIKPWCSLCYELARIFVRLVTRVEWCKGLIFTMCNSMSYNILSFVLMANLF